MDWAKNVNQTQKSLREAFGVLEFYSDIIGEPILRKQIQEISRDIILTDGQINIEMTSINNNTANIDDLIKELDAKIYAESTQPGYAGNSANLKAARQEIENAKIKIHESNANMEALFKKRVDLKSLRGSKYRNLLNRIKRIAAKSKLSWKNFVQACGGPQQMVIDGIFLTVDIARNDEDSWRGRHRQQLLDEFNYEENEEKELIAAYNRLRDAYCGYKYANGTWQSKCECDGPEFAVETETVEETELNTPAPNDPNEIVGPLGVGNPVTERFLKPGEEVAYTIYFENKSDAETAAQEIRVTGTLDPSLDWSTFKLGEVAFNNQIDNNLSGFSSGTSEVKMSGTNYYVRTEASCDPATGKVSWYLRIVDKTTVDEWPTDLHAGILPPNDDTFRGEGHVTYRVKVRDDAAPNAVINASASIVFDYNDPITTDPAWSNKVAQVASVKVNGDVEGDVSALGLIVGMPYGELPTPKARAGYTFGGWFTGPNGMGRRVRAQDPVQAGDSGLYAYWLAHAYTVHFEPNGGTGAMSDQAFEFGKEAELDANAFLFAGHSFGGWATNETGAAVFVDCAAVENLTDDNGGVVTLYATWTVNSYAVTFDANGGEGGWSSNLVYGTAIVVPTVTRTGYNFTGWQPALLATVPARDVTFTAQWEAIEPVVPEPEPEPDLEPDVTPTPEPPPQPTPGQVPVPAAAERLRLCSDVAGAVPAVAALYDGYICDGAGNVKGTIQVKVGKPGKKDGCAAVSAVVVGLDGNKIKLKASDKGKAQIAGDGPTTVELDGGRGATALPGGGMCAVTLGANGMSGNYGAYEIDGARNVFASKDSADKAAAAAVLGKWKGAVNVAWRRVEDNAPYQTLCVTIAAKGKAKVAGTLADGTKVSAGGQLSVGEEWCCVPVVCAKKGVSLQFAVWLPKAATSTALPVVVGLGDDVKVGRPGALKGGAAFRIDADAFAARWGQRALPYLPDGVAVGGGSKWTLPKAGSVAYEKGTTTVDEAKAGENPSGLKLTYKAKDGTFKGSFKAYVDVGGKPKATKVDVTGVLVDGVGYGAATVKKVGGVAVTVE